MTRAVKLSERLAYLICPVLRDEIAALRSGNTKVVLENQKLMDQLKIERERLARVASDIPFELAAQLSKPAREAVFSGRLALRDKK
jgi:hypothetical protein